MLKFIFPKCQSLAISALWNKQRYLIRPIVYKNVTQQSFNRNFCILDSKTNVTKDVILFKYENPKQYRAINFFALAQFFFWNYLSYTALTNLRDAPVDEDVGMDQPIWRRINLGENKYRYGLSILCFLIGYGVLIAGWMFTLRSVRFLVLLQGGRTVSIVTYGPFGKNRIMDVPLKCMSAEESRQSAKVTLPIKVKNTSFYFILDMRGEFKNPALFDQTVGLRRNIK